MKVLLCGFSALFLLVNLACTVHESKDLSVTHVVSEKTYSIKYEFKGNRSPAIVSNR